MSYSASASKNEIEPDWDFLDYCSALERKWSEDLLVTLPKSEAEWLKIFPKAETVIPQKIKEWEVIAIRAREEIRAALAIMDKKSSKENQSFWRSVLKYLHPAVKELAFAQKRTKRLRLLLPSNSNRGVRKWHEEIAIAKQRSMVEIAANYGIKLRKLGKTYQALCPLHTERTPSFIIYPPSRFICFGCGAKGSSIDFVMAQENYSFKDAVHKMQNL